MTRCYPVLALFLGLCASVGCSPTDDFDTSFAAGANTEPSSCEMKKRDGTAVVSQTCQAGEGRAYCDVGDWTDPTSYCDAGARSQRPVVNVFCNYGTTNGGETECAAGEKITCSCLAADVTCACTPL